MPFGAGRNDAYGKVAMAKHVCPFWVGYLLASPIRKLFENPRRLLAPYVREGMKVLDIGCAMGFFSLPLAEMAGSSGRVICVDVQARMLGVLEKRARKAGLCERIETRACPEQTLALDDLREQIDFALASAVVHEVPHPPRFFSELCAVIKPGGLLLVMEPKGHISKDAFERTIALAEETGFQRIHHPIATYNRAALLKKRKTHASAQNAPNHTLQRTRQGHAAEL